MKWIACPKCGHMKRPGKPCQRCHGVDVKHKRQNHKDHFNRGEA